MKTGQRMRTSLFVFLALLGLLEGTGASSARDATRPNFIVILTDDQDVVLGSLDFMPLTRELIAQQGTTFSNHFVPLSLCCPSRSTILTGQHAHNHRVYTNFPPAGGFERFDKLGHAESTLATTLHDAGYYTALIGKYLNGYPDKADLTHIPPGWDEWISPVQGSPYAAYRYTLNENRKLVKHASKPEDYMTDVLAGKATAFIRRAAARGQPFFLFLSTYAPHKPATPAKRHAGLFPGLKAPRTPSFNEANVLDKPARIRGLKRLEPEQIAAIDALFRKQMLSLQAVDEAVAALVEALEKAGQLDNTFLVFTSDNGFHMGQHRLEPGKYTPYEPDVHVPLLVRGPGVPSGATVSLLTSSVDLAPTLAELARAALAVASDGRSLVPLLHAEVPPNWRQAVLLEQFALPPAPPSPSKLLEPPDSVAGRAIEYPGHRGLRTRGLKFVEYGNGEREVYDLRRDPDELTNLRNQLPKAWLKQLSSRIKALADCAGQTCRQIEAQPVPALPPAAQAAEAVAGTRPPAR